MEFALKYHVNVRTLSPHGLKIKLEGDEDMRANLAQNHALLRVDSFIGDFQLTPAQQGKIILSGRLVADIVQRCVVSAQPLPARIDAPVEVVFMPQESPLSASRNQEETAAFIDAAYDDEDVEFFSGHSVDIGAVVEEFFDLALNPYPRKEGVTFAPSSKMQEEKTEKDAPASPFAILAKLK